MIIISIKATKIVKAVTFFIVIIMIKGILMITKINIITMAVVKILIHYNDSERDNDDNNNDVGIIMIIMKITIVITIIIMIMTMIMLIVTI